MQLLILVSAPFGLHLLIVDNFGLNRDYYQNLFLPDLGFNMAFCFWFVSQIMNI